MSDGTPTTPELFIRTDDIGLCHSANAAIEKVLQKGIVTAISLMVTTPWLDHAVHILKEHKRPGISIGVHLVLNSEWNEYRWGPVAPVSDVPTLVDRFGKFFGRRRDMLANGAKPSEVEREFRAQIELALARGLKISYLDCHMEAGFSTPEFREIVEKLADQYGLVISNYFGEQLASIYHTPPAEKLTQAVKTVKSLSGPGRHIIIAHPSLDTPELEAFTDQNENGLPNMSKHRQAEASLLCNPAFAEAIEKQGISLLDYEKLRDRERDQMKRPV